MDLCETGEADLRDPRQVSEVDLEKLFKSNTNLDKQQKEKLIEVLLRYTGSTTESWTQDGRQRNMHWRQRYP